MRVHHLNCISTCPFGGWLMDGHSLALRGRLVCHCLLVEMPSCLVLVDTGFGLRDVSHPRTRLSWFFRALLAPELAEAGTAIRQVAALGFDPRDVRHIVLTHLDFDHAGGLDDFPWASVHLPAAEAAVATAQRSWLDRQRFRPQQWGTRANWRLQRAGGESWNGFAGTSQVDGLPPELLYVPLPGHTLGHAGVAVRAAGPGGREWLLQAGDAYFDHREMQAQPRCTPGLRFYQWMMEQDRAARLANQARLRGLHGALGSRIQVLCSHDPAELRLAADAGTRARAGSTARPAAT
jgi:glyoxylase-like metal-dependent hydrolase (beta-lactamase superfamily II)